jgi:PhoPQ-activated pathogenicity-related protein
MRAQVLIYSVRGGRVADRLQIPLKTRLALCLSLCLADIVMLAGIDHHLIRHNLRANVIRLTEGAIYGMIPNLTHRVIRQSVGVASIPDITGACQLARHNPSVMRHLIHYLILLGLFALLAVIYIIIIIMSRIILHRKVLK